MLLNLNMAVELVRQTRAVTDRWVTHD